MWLSFFLFLVTVNTPYRSFLIAIHELRLNETGNA